ncbi:non-hydrolyzing UDP-N-acetylglucosamine 2-epimerase [Prauserella flavalba]|uniref:non-hydrolyzing UDP-N-acetylglucosamine 2-epimerase n=1 Tax=Prauserella flavalba TaxID=1477506 RepID=UPI0036EEEFF0
MTVAVVVGTRPEAIKLAPIVELLGSRALVIHTGQHYSASMSGTLTPHLGLPAPPPWSAARPATRSAQLGHLTAALGHVFTSRRPAVVVVHGDTTSALAGALAANTAGLPLVHVEAGLRSFDRAMPEEHHRVLIDHLADLCCAPTPTAHENLLAERIPPDRIQLTGNTIVEALEAALPSAEYQARTLAHFGLVNDGYVLATFHRPENVDQPDNLSTILAQLDTLPSPVLLPAHPRTRSRIDNYGLHEPTGALRLVEPLDYPDFLALACHAALIISDSGGIQEEATVLKRPILVVRRSTERPEIEGTFGQRTTPGPHLASLATYWLSNRPRKLAELASPYGDGRASRRIVHSLDAMANEITTAKTA